MLHILPTSKTVLLKTCLLAIILISMALSLAFAKLPYLSDISSGIRVIILTVAISLAAAVLFPVKEDGYES